MNITVMSDQARKIIDIIITEDRNLINLSVSKQDAQEMIDLLELAISSLED